MPGGAIRPRYWFFLGPVSISPSEKNRIPVSNIQPLPVRPATSTPVVAPSMPMNMHDRVRIFRTSHETGTISRIMRNEFKEIRTTWGMRMRPSGAISVQALKGQKSGTCRAIIELSTQSSMKLGCRSQSWYIIAQKQDMMSSQATSRASTMFLNVRQRTCKGFSVLEAPLGMSGKRIMHSRLTMVKPAQARNIRCQPSAVRGSPRSMGASRWPKKEPTFTIQ